MSRGKNNGITLEFISIRTSYAKHAIIVHEKSTDARFEVNFTAKFLNGFSNGLNDTGQFIRSNMCMRINQNALMRAMLDKQLQYFTNITALLGIRP